MSFRSFGQGRLATAVAVVALTGVAVLSLALRRARQIAVSSGAERDSPPGRIAGPPRTLDIV